MPELSRFYGIIIRMFSGLPNAITPRIFTPITASTSPCFPFRLWL